MSGTLRSREESLIEHDSLLPDEPPPRSRHLLQPEPFSRHPSAQSPDWNSAVAFHLLITLAINATDDIRYLCQRCGNCCRWPGDIRVTPSDITRIARFLCVAESEFIQNFTRLTANRQALSIIDKPNGECFFLKGNECTIQPVKPAQCSGFPNTWNFPGWRQVCEAIPVSATADDDDLAPRDEASTAASSSAL